MKINTVDLNRLFIIKIYPTFGKPYTLPPKQYCKLVGRKDAQNHFSIAIGEPKHDHKFERESGVIICFIPKSKL
jgi:hypothetical protein